ncbi:hypothetical protein GFA94_19795 [Escherichia coli]|nr:hypothetical protein [Escherichia coli]EEY5719015.1 hypothetical protein [Escherichia coli]EFH9091356.1 hypothetical protein [Escherichia coli]MHN57903.1 hypothetical protein [Escherichia coli]MHQ56200.1 hypothetical protein [Escherichia coli]
MIVGNNHFAGQGLPLLKMDFSNDNFPHINYCLKSVIRALSVKMVICVIFLFPRSYQAFCAVY